MNLPDLLDVHDVQKRYGLRDPRAARNVIHEAGGFKIGGKLLIRISTLDEYETANSEEQSGSSTDSRSTINLPASKSRPLPPLQPDWLLRDD